MYVTRVLEMDQIMAAKGNCEANPIEIIFGQNKSLYRRLNTRNSSKLEQLISDSWTKLDTDKLSLSFKHCIVWL